MAKIVVNEISANYGLNIGSSSYATVALPITSCWGPGYFDPALEYGTESASTVEKMLEKTTWYRFPATQAGLDAFIATYRGASDIYRIANDNSYQMALTLLAAGYDVLACRICPGIKATGFFSTYEADTETDTDTDTDSDTEVDPDDYKVSLKAKYPGSFGNNIQLAVRKLFYTKNNQVKYYWNVITYVVDANGVRSSVENKSFVFDIANSTDTIPYYNEIESDFWDITGIGSLVSDDGVAPSTVVNLSGGADYNDQKILNVGEASNKLKNIAKLRFDWAKQYQGVQSDIYEYYYNSIATLITGVTNLTMLNIYYYQEWIRTSLVGMNYTIDDVNLGGVLDLLKDKLTYNPNRVISPGWDDQDFTMYDASQQDIDTIINPTGQTTKCPIQASPLHLKLMDVAYYSRCATGYIDVPKILDRKFVHIESTNPDNYGYIQLLARIVPVDSALETNAPLYTTHCGFFAPWGQYTYVGTGKMTEASPSFLALVIQRAQILNQAIQYEWALPTNRKHNLKLGKMEYTVPKKVLDQWQKLEGASVNVITNIPDLGTNIWGNSTMYEVPPATYQALANLSTRFLVNAIEDLVYRCGIAITFQYNNREAFSSFYAGVSPLLDTMRNVGAIEGYTITMSNDVNAEDAIASNTVLGQIQIYVNSIINDLIIDLVALPASSSSTVFAG